MPVVSFELENHVAVITLNRPEAMNTFNLEMYKDFNVATELFRKEKSARVAVIRAAGDEAFSAGVDLKALNVAMDGKSEAEQAELVQMFNIDIEGEYFCDKPIIAAIQGYCIGEGLSMALGCDLRIAGESATFALPESKVGVPTINAAIHGARLMGVSNALELLLLGEQRDAAWAYRTGLVNRVVADTDVLSAAMEWAEKIASLSPLANQITKEAAVRSRYRTFDETVEIAAAKRDTLLKSHDMKEGRQAFIEKRAPKFIGA